MKIRILGISASLRNSRHSAGSLVFCEELTKILSKKALFSYLDKQASIRLEDFMAAGRASKKSFDEIYRELIKLKGERGLSNSEIALGAGLWGALQEGADIEHLALGRYFPASGESIHLEKLRNAILRADAILLSGPVYFGDRGSLAHDFIVFLNQDPICIKHLRNRVYAGISVGAKRNGGQETQLIYQMIDMSNLNMLVVGNDSATTSQYGGTVVAGDIGQASKDDYGLNTAIGTGRRLAQTTKMISLGKTKKLRDKTRIGLFMLQDDASKRGLTLIKRFCKEVEERAGNVKFELKYLVNKEVRRCIACDICPIDLGTPEEYRCIIKSKSDLFVTEHNDFINLDGIILGAYSPRDRSKVFSVYQKFIERTRYLRRDDYLLGNILASPLVISEINSNQNLHIRMLTSLVRHHTILHHPIIGVEQNQEVLNWDDLITQGISFAKTAGQLAAGKLALNSKNTLHSEYNPVGYIISAQHKADKPNVEKAAQVAQKKFEAHKKTQEIRLEETNDD